MLNLDSLPNMLLTLFNLGLDALRFVRTSLRATLRSSPNTVHLTILTDAEKLMRRVCPRLRGRSG